jgi:prophage regulatory protein
MEHKMKLLSYDDLNPLKGISYSKTHLWRLEKVDAFPKRVHLGANRVAWAETEIDRWIEQRIAARDARLAERGRADASAT